MGGPTGQLMTRDGKTRSVSYGTCGALPLSQAGACQLRAPSSVITDGSIEGRNRVCPREADHA